MATQKKKTRRKKTVAAKTVAAKTVAAKTTAVEPSNPIIEAVETILPPGMAKLMDESGIKPSEAFYLGVVAMQFTSNLSPIQTSIIDYLLKLQTDTPGTL
jgi:hypothetical protein